MSKLTRTATLLLSLVLIFSLLASCTSDTPNASPTGQTPGTSVEPTGELPVAGEFKLPIVSEPVTLSQWRSFTSTVVTTPADIKANAETERLTNVHIEYQLSPALESAEGFNLLMASQEYPDLLFMRDGTSSTQYIGGHDKAIEDGVFLRLNELIDKWAPHYKAMQDSNDTIYRQSVTDQGNMAVFATIQDGNEPAWTGPMIRKDYLDKVGLEVPETYDELYTALTAFKNDLKVEQPLSISYLGYNIYGHSLTSGFDIDPTFYNENGVVKFGFIEEGFRDYLTTMNKWYTEGLIDQDFFSKSADTFGNQEDVVNGKVGALEHGIGSRMSVYKHASTDENFRMVGLPIPRKNANDVAHFRRVNEIIGTTPVALTTALEDDPARLEVAVRWMDFRFTEQGYNLLNYGIENESYEIVDGRPQFTEFIYNNPDGTPFPDMSAAWAETGNGSFYIWSRNYIAYSQDQLDAFDTWGRSASGDWVMPPVTMTSDEGSEFSSIYTDISTMVNESVPKFITGARPLSEFDSFVDQQISMGIERCIEIYQAALDRYNNR